MFEKLNPIILLCCILISIIFNISTTKKDVKNIKMKIFNVLNIIIILYYTIRFILECNIISIINLNTSITNMLDLILHIILALIGYLLFVYLEITNNIEIIKKKSYLILSIIPCVINILLHILGFNINNSIININNKLYSLITIQIYILIPSIKTFKSKTSYKAKNYLMISYIFITIFLGLLHLIYSDIFMDLALFVILFLEFIFIHNYELDVNTSYSKIIAFSKLFNTTIYLNVKSKKYEIISNEQISNKKYDYDKFRVFFLKHYIDKYYTKELTKITSIEYMLKTLSKDNPYYSYVFKGNDNVYYRLYCILTSSINDLPNQNIIISIMDINEEVKLEYSQRKLLEEALISSNNSQKKYQEYLSILSHDLRTPISSILGYSELISINPTNKEYLDNLKISSNNLLDLFNNLLQNEKIEFDKNNLNYSIQNISHLIKEIVSIMDPNLKEHNIYLDLSIDDNINVYAKIDKTKIMQILINIINNAIKYSKEYSTINLKSYRNNDSFYFIIEDDGIGIDDKFINKIFTPFNRDQNTNNIEGTGLGLTIVKELLDTLNGTIEIKSKINEGTKVQVMIPLKYIDPSKYKLLLIEDNIINNQMQTSILNNLGFKTISLINTKELKIILKENFNLILIDLYLDNKPCFDIIKLIRKNFEKLPIIVLTGSTSEKDINKCYEIGISDIITKPMDINIFISKIFKLLNGN